MKKHNLAFVDVETTGTDPFKHEIIEIAGIIARQVPQPDRGSQTRNNRGV
jgi:oligoribonuclease (3'-5' exoribonuclease)